MDSTLLATKLRIPPRPHHEIDRPRLIDALGDGIPDHKLVLIAAPAGYGKTTLLAQWAATCRFPVAWVSLGEGDNDWERFFRYLLTAWEEVRPGVRETSLGLLLGGIGPDRDAVLGAFVNVAAAVPDHTVFVLDDVHLIDEPEVHQALAFLLDHLPPALHFVLAGRAEPSLPLARYRARQELLELRVDDLHFSADETEAFLTGLTGVQLTRDEISTLHDRLEGWVAGLQLAALSLRRRGAPEALAIGGRHRFIADYLSEDVLAQLPGALRRFLLQTSILDRLCGPLCDFVTGMSGGQEMLERAERENLFLVPLDDRREWYRYHHLFGDFLREELRKRHPDEVANLHRRAAEWCLARDMPEPAFDHALAANDPELVIRIFERYQLIKLHSGELRLIARWLDALPAEWYEAHPVFGLPRSGLLAFTGAFDDSLRCIEETERRLTLTASADATWQLAMVTSVRCFIACIQNDQATAEAYADRALRDLREESLPYRSSIYHALGDTYRRNGRWDDARRCYHTILGFTDWPGYRVQSAHVFGALADLELGLGHLRTASDYWQKALAAIQDQTTWGRLELPLTGWFYIRTGELLYEWNDLAGAWDHLSRGLERAELGGDVRSRIAGYVLAARVKLAAGDAEAAATYLERARPLVEQAPFPDWTGRYERCRLELWLAQNRLRVAAEWAEPWLDGGPMDDRPEGGIARLALARALIAREDAAARRQATDLLAPLRLAGEPGGRAGARIEALALHALACWSGGDRAGALASLEQALRLAEPEGYVRLFADLGLPMARLLQEARSRDVMPDYVGALLVACGGGPSNAGSAPAALPEPLSRREQDVLRLITAGLTNREIGEALFISPETVKKHTASIYAKLGVRHRAEAAIRARNLGLLG